MGRCRNRARARILWSVLCALSAASLCGADVDVVVNLAGADRVLEAPVQAISGFVELFSMDNSDLFVAMCLPGTFSPDNEGICHDCVKCIANQYEKIACIPTRDRTCANCTVCGTHDIELCQCAIKTSQCITGDRICLKVPPTSVNLNVDFSTGVVLTSRQLAFVKAGLAAGFTEWLAVQFDVDVDTVELVDVVRFDPTNFQARFRFNEVYGAAKVNRILGQPHSFYQGGFAYTFGVPGARRRRLLQVAASRSLLQVAANEYYINANGASGSCDVNTTCSQEFYEWVYDENSTCTGKCMPVLCPPGYGGYATNCQPCEPGTFKAETGYGDCEECPAGHTSPTGSNSSDACYPSEVTSAGGAASSTNTSSGSQASSEMLQSFAQQTSSETGSTPSPQQLQPASSTTPSSTSPSTPPTTSSLATSPSTSASSQGSSAASSRQSSHAQETAAPPTTAPSPPPPPPWTGQTSSSTGGTTGGTGSSSSGGGGSVSVNVNVNVQAPSVVVQVPPPPPPVVVQVPAAPPPAAPPIFNNYVTIQAPPAPPSMPDGDEYHYHWHGYRDWRSQDALGDDWVAAYLFVFLFVGVFAGVLCLWTPCCGGCDYGGDGRTVSRTVVRYRLVRDDTA